MYQTETNIRVRYGETDRMGYVYYAYYAQYFEVGRTEMLRTLGFTYRQWEDSGIILPVKSLSIQYIAPATYDDLLEIRTILKDRPTARISFDYEIMNETGELLCTGNTVLVFADARTRRPTRPPAEFMNALSRVWKV
ncbi:MAG: thioesterase [Bacteroides sp. SM23_62_1]|nr:MAG: thioesterase [Bacteroides sp. SM23_62_1]